MKRRTFIRQIVLLASAPSLLLPRKTFGQPSGWSPGELAAVGKPPAAAGCSLFASNTNMSGFNTTTNFAVLSQKIICATERSVCKVLIYQNTAEGTGTIFIRIRSAANNGGTLHGTSDSLSNNATGWRTFNFTTPALVSADFFLTVITSAGLGYAAVRSSGTGSNYSDTNADMFSGNTDINEDMLFECHTQ